MTLTLTNGTALATTPADGTMVQILKSLKTLKKVLGPYGVHIHSLHHTYTESFKDPRDTRDHSPEVNGGL